MKKTKIGEINLKGLKALVMMQLKDKLDLSFLRDKKGFIFKIVFALIKFALITGAIYLGFYLLSYLRLTSLYAGINTNFFALVFSIMFILSLIACTFGLTDWLYLARDNQVLLTMPASRTTVFLSKWFVYYIYEFLRNLTYIIPILVAYGLINNIAIWFYFWLLPANFIITLLSLSISALLSIPMLFLKLFAERFKVLKYTFIVVVVTLIFVGLVKLINAIPADLDIVANWGTIFWQIQDMLNNFTLKFAPLYYLAVAFVGKRVGLVNKFFVSEQLLALLAVFGVIVATFGLTFLIIRPLFFKMTSSPFEFTKLAGVKFKHNNKSSAFGGSFKKELLITLRSANKVNNLVLIALILPISILLLNKIFSAMDTRLSGTLMTMAFNVLMILLISLSSNGMVAKIYSEEGRSSYLNKTAPTSYAKVLIPKLLINLVVINISIIVSCCIFAVNAKFDVLTSLLTCVSLCSIYTGHLFWSASLDIMNPQNEQYATTGAQTNNPNETKSTIMAFIVSAVFTYLFYFLVSERLDTVWIKLIFVALAFVGWNIFMYFSKVKLYYKEK